MIGEGGVAVKVGGKGDGRAARGRDGAAQDRGERDIAGAARAAEPKDGIDVRVILQRRQLQRRRTADHHDHAFAVVLGKAEQLPLRRGEGEHVRGAVVVSAAPGVEVFTGLPAEKDHAHGAGAVRLRALVDGGGKFVERAAGVGEHIQRRVAAEGGVLLRCALRERVALPPHQRFVDVVKGKG